MEQTRSSFFPCKRRGACHRQNKKNKGQNIQTLQNRVVKENNFNKDVKIKKYAAVQLRISLRGKFFMSHWARLQKTNHETKNMNVRFLHLRQNTNGKHFYVLVVRVINQWKCNTELQYEGRAHTLFTLITKWKSSVSWTDFLSHRLAH